jgi:hypothetical protein
MYNNIIPKNLLTFSMEKMEIDEDHQPPTTPPVIVTKLKDLPPFSQDIPSLQWSPCVIISITKVPFHLTINDPYVRHLVNHFLHTNVICSDELCLTVLYCHPLWLALYVSNYMKKMSSSINQYKNTYMHPIRPYNLQIHTQQHPK